jgi:hypothetical protein
MGLYFLIVFHSITIDIKFRKYKLCSPYRTFWERIAAPRIVIQEKNVPSPIRRTRV